MQNFHHILTGTSCHSPYYLVAQRKHSRLLSPLSYQILIYVTRWNSLSYLQLSCASSDIIFNLCQYLFYHSKYRDIYANKTEWTTFADESLKQYTNFIRPVYVHCEICFIPIHLYFWRFKYDNQDLNKDIQGLMFIVVD